MKDNISKVQKNKCRREGTDVKSPLIPTLKLIGKY
jgi:hypothetical protein